MTKKDEKNQCELRVRPDKTREFWVDGKKLEDVTFVGCSMNSNGTAGIVLSFPPDKLTIKNAEEK